MNHKETGDAVVIIALGMIPGMGNTRINRLLAQAQRSGWNMTTLRKPPGKNFLKCVCEWDATLAALLGRYEKRFFEEASAVISHALRQGLQVVHTGEEAYPESLKRYLGDAAPPLFFVRGNPELLHKTAGAVVGTRSPSKGGIQAAGDAATALIAHEALLVSGGAAGIDRAAHDAAINAGGSTVAWLPQGILSWPCPGGWRAALDDGRVALASAYLPDAPWQTHGAVARNALISAMAQVVCVVEPRKQGGSILTMRHAIHQRKPVFVEPLSALAAALRVQARPLRELAQALPTMDLAEMLLHGAATGVQESLL